MRRSNINIIEDCSPFFIRYKFDQLDAVIALAASEPPVRIRKEYGTREIGYYDKKLPVPVAQKIASLIPISKIFNFNMSRFSIFETPAGGGAGIHKDGHHNRVSFNIPLRVLDDKCRSAWYSDNLFDSMAPLSGLKTKLPVNGHQYSQYRSIYPDYNTIDQFTPLKTMIAKVGELILFNTNIYHSWSNVRSNNIREMLTIRVINNSTLYFDNAAKLIDQM